MGNWLSATLDPESDIATPTPSVLTLHERYSLDPRSPSTFFKRTPILVCDKPNPVLDPRSPSFEINRTPLFCSYHKENEVTTTQVPQPAAVFTPSPITKMKPLCFEVEEEEEQESESSYLSIVSEQNISTTHHHDINLAEPDFLSDQMTHLVAECSVSDKPDICCDSVSKLDDQGVSVAKLPELDNFSNKVSESDICSDRVHRSLDKQSSTEILWKKDQKEAETENGNLEKNCCSGGDGDGVTDAVGDVLNLDVGIDGSYISSIATAVTCTVAAGQKQQLPSVDAPDQKERTKASSIPLAVKKKTRTETTEVGLQKHCNNNNYKNKKTTKVMVGGVGRHGGVVSGVRSPLQSRNCGSAITGNNRYRSSLAKMPARANFNSTGGVGVKIVPKPVGNWGFESNEVKSVHDKENMSIRWPK